MPRKIIIDTDPGVDDVLAVLLALASPELHPLAITITFGNTHAPVAYNNLLKIYASLARELQAFPHAKERFPGVGAEEKVVLALGADGPVGGEKAVAAYFHGTDGLSNISETHPHFDPPQLAEGESHAHLDLSRKHASEVILDCLQKEEPGSVTIIALGPLSNLALALRADPETFARVGQVVWMGGAIDVPGNTSPTAEFNCFADPYAAHEVLEAVKRGAFEMVMAPLDITTPHTIHFDQLIHDVEQARAGANGRKELTPLREFTSAMLVRVRGLMKSFGLPDEMEMHDPVAVWYAIENGPHQAEGNGWRTKPRVFSVERTGELTRGMCVVDRRGTDEEDAVLRTKSAISSGKNEDQNAKRGSSRTGAPRVITHTPGKATLEKMLLGRIFAA